MFACCVLSVALNRVQSVCSCVVVFVTAWVVVFVFEIVCVVVVLNTKPVVAGLGVHFEIGLTGTAVSASDVAV